MKLFNDNQPLHHVPAEDETNSPYCVSSRTVRKRSRRSSSRLFNNQEEQQKPQREETQRRVSFSTMVNCIEITHIDDMDQSEIDAQWLTGEEMRDIKDMATAVARYMTSSSSKSGKQTVVDDTDEYCFRGLEYRTIEGVRNKRENRDLVRAAVKLQQDIYGRGVGAGNPGRVAFASMRNSLVSRKEAVERAKLDALSAREYHVTNNERLTQRCQEEQ